MTGTPKATVGRILSVLAENQYAQKDPESGRYSLGWRIVQLSSCMLNSVQLRMKAKPHLLSLMERTGETVNLGILHEGHVLYVDRVNSVKTVRLYSVVGKTIPAHCSAMGKAILAFSSESVLENVLQRHGLPARTRNTVTDLRVLRQQLGRVRETGIALDSEEHQEGVLCVGAPVFDHSGQVVGAISVSAPTTRLEGPTLQSVVSYVKSTAREVSCELGQSL